MRLYLYALKVLLLGASVTALACQQGATTSSSVSNTRREAVNLDGIENGILREVNAYRKKIGKQPLQMLEAASTQAEIHSRNMAQRKTGFGHDGFESRITNIRKQTTGTINSAAENVAYGELTAQKVVDGWLHSPGHKKNIEGDYNLTGIGVAKDKEGRVYYTQIFLRK